MLGVPAHLPSVPQRAVCLPVLARLWRPRQPGRTKLTLACELVGLAAARVGDRPVQLVADAAYDVRALRQLPAHVTVTTRLRCDAALYELAPPPTGRRGRPRTKGDRLPELIVLAALTRVRWRQATVVGDGQRHTVELAVWRCVWYGVFGARPVQVVLVRTPGATDGDDLALVATDLAATPPSSSGGTPTAGAWRSWSKTPGRRPASARPATAPAARPGRTVPFGRCCVSLVVVWYASNGQPAVDVAARRARAPWYQQKHAPSTADMLAALRRAIIAAQYLPARPAELTAAEILAVQHAWAAAAA